MKGNVCFILARGGSKRIPRKNVRMFCGRPMVSWPVSHARASLEFAEVVVSTDDVEIAEAAVRAGASFHGLRPEALSGDYATTAEVLHYELGAYAGRNGGLPDLCCCLYGTSALVTPALLKQGLALLREGEAGLVMAVLPYAHPIERALRFNASGGLEYRQPEFVPVRTQDIDPSYHDTGLFYWFAVQAFLEAGGNSFVPLKKSAVIVSRQAAVDIDTEEDWERAEQLARLNGLGGHAS